MALYMRNVTAASNILKSSLRLTEVNLGRHCCTRTLKSFFTFPKIHTSAPIRSSRWLHSHEVKLGQSRHGMLCAAVVITRGNATATDLTPPPPPSAPLQGEIEKDGILQSLPEGYIPEPPSASGLTAPLDIELNALGEPTLASLDLAHSTPAGLVQSGLEMLHVGLDIPWWSAIVIGTICLRILIFPLVILSQRNAANMTNHMPTVQLLQERLTQARMSGNPLEAARVGNELMDYMNRNKVSPFKNMLVPMAQLPIFLSVFTGLRAMANLPVESMKTGGIMWFTDLTIQDPFYALPIMTMATFLLTIELGVDTMKTSAMSHNVKWAMRVMPFVFCPFIIKFPAAMLCYWMTSNTFSLVQLLFLKIPVVRDFLKIPQITDHTAQKIKPAKRKFVEGFQENWKNSKLMAQMEDRARLDAVRFKESGLGPIEKTYPYDPTKKSPQQKSSDSKRKMS